MSGSNNGSDKVKAAADALAKVQENAEKLKSNLDGKKAEAVFDQNSKTQKSGAPKTSTVKAPNPAEPMDHAALESIGLVSANKALKTSSVTSITSLADVQKEVAKESLIPNSKQTGMENSSGGIAVNPDYKPAFQSDNKSKLVASMDKPKQSDPTSANSPASLQSRLEQDQGNLYRASTTSQKRSDKPLGGGFRMASDPNEAQSPSSSYATNNAMSQAPQQDGMVSQAENVSQTIHHQETAKKSGGGIGTIGLLGGLLLASGATAVVMKPELLSTTGSEPAVMQTVSASDALIPETTRTQPQITRVAPEQIIAPPQQQPRRMAAVSMPQPAQPAIQKSAPAPAVSNTDKYAENGKDIPLKLTADGLKVKKDQYIRVGGMPDDATLSSGVDMGDGNWLVAPNALADLKLTTGDGFKGTMDLYIQAVKDDATTAIGTPKPFKVHVGQKPQVIAAVQPKTAPAIVQPAAEVASYNPAPAQVVAEARPQPAPVKFREPKLPALPEGIADSADGDGFGALPTAQVNKYKRPTARRRAAAPARAPRQLREALPVGRTFSRSNYGDTAVPIRQQRVASATPQRSIPQVSDRQARVLLKRGNNLYRLGDLISARSLYGQVAAGGNAEAAVAMGRTYDPIYFEKLGVQGFEPDSRVAMEWYQKAKDGGSSKAQSKIDNLNYYLQR